MVYCGKASQGCQSCRTRRIKCDKVKPECSQCVRVGKKCPGYRDQLSLMFRDESSKVIQKAHAQWGVAEAPGPSSRSQQQRQLPPQSHPGLQQAQQPSPPPHQHQPQEQIPFASYPQVPQGQTQSLSPASSTDIPYPSYPSSRSSSASGPSTIASSLHSQSPSPTDYDRMSPVSALSAVTQYHIPPLGSPMSLSIGPSMEERGVQFYVNHYLLGQPDEPRSKHDLTSLTWLFHPRLQGVMAAVGLAGLSNLTGDMEMSALSRQKYGSALRDTGQLLTRPSPGEEETTLRTIVMLALFEVVRGTHHSAHSVNAHIIGAAALMKNMVPVANAPGGGVRGLFQLVYSLMLPCYAAGTPLPNTVHDVINFNATHLPESDRPVADIGMMGARFLFISAFVRGHILTDGRPKTEELLQQMLTLEGDLEEWETRVPDEWKYTSGKNSILPPTATFQQQYHIYPDMWVARMWNHYRWIRIITNEMILKFVDQFPDTSLLLVSALRRRKCLETNHRMAEDILISTPSHWRHPHLDDKAKELIPALVGTGAGAVGVPALLHHLRVAACTPGMSPQTFDWSYRMVQNIWADMGMLHARLLLEMMDKHRSRMTVASTAYS